MVLMQIHSKVIADDGVLLRRSLEDQFLHIARQIRP